MNKMLITGLPLSDPDPRCAPCNIDYENLFLHPSYFLWADKLVLPEYIWEVITDNKGTRDSSSVQVLKIIIEMLDSVGMIERINSLSILTDDVWEKIDSEIDKDIRLFHTVYPQSVSTSDHMILKFGKSEFCYPRIRYVYASLFLSQTLDCQCLFDSNSIELCNMKFGISKLNTSLQTSMKYNGLVDVFSSILPDDFWSPVKLLTEQCQTCARLKDKCLSEIMTRTEKEVETYLQWRDYDEVHCIKEKVEGIIRKKSKNDGLLSPEEIKLEFDSQKSRLTRAMHQRFPKIKRWSKYITLFSIPASFIGYFSGNVPAGIVAQSVGAASLLANTIIENKLDKHNWINFTLKDKTINNG